MNELDNLIRELCPDGVKTVPLWKVTIWDKHFKSVEKDKQKQVYKYKYFLANDIVPLIVSEGDIKILTTSETNLYTSSEYISGEYYEREIIAIPWGGTPIVQYYNGKFITTDNRIATSYDSTVLNNKFLYYSLLSKLNIIASYYRGSGLKHPDMGKVLDLEIELPPMEIQEKIVKILDIFQDLRKVLLTEQSLRKKQYFYFKDRILEADESVKWMTLDEISTIGRGASPRPIKKFITEDENGINWIKIGDVHSDSKFVTSTKEKITADGAKKSKFVKKGDFILSNSMSFGRPYILKIDGCIHDGWLVISNYEKYVSSDYLYYILTSSVIQKELKQKAAFGGAYANLNIDIVKTVSIPIPSLDRQKEIVEKLNIFETFIGDDKIGLPAELEKRQIQFDFYLQKLFRF